MMRIIQDLAQFIRIHSAAAPFMQATKNPYNEQIKLLLSIVKQNKDTQYGKKHHFKLIKSVEDFRKYVPIQKYNGFAQYIESLKKNKAPTALTGENVFMFGITSGTTGSPKLVPITRTFVSQYRKAWDIWMAYTYADHPGIFDGKVLVMVAPEREGYTAGGIPYGSISGVIQNHASAAIKHFYSLPYSVQTIKDYNAKYYTMLRIALEQDISMIVTPNPSMLLLLSKKIDEVKDDIVADIEKGTLSTRFNIEKNIREELKFKPNPKRALEILRLEKENKGLFPKHIWPRLKLIGCWKEGTLPIYLRQFPRYFGETSIRDIGLISTEGQSSVPITDEALGGVLIVNSVFFEFLPVGSKSRVDTKLVWDLELGKDYFRQSYNFDR